MKTLKYILFGVLLLLIIKPINAQQASFYTQYMFNDYLINPAVAGVNNYFQLRANTRIQWMGMDGAPRTMSISGFGPFKERDMGYGGYIHNDVTGPESRLSVGGTYGYNMNINDYIRISGGLTIGFMQYKLDGTIMEFNKEVEDPAMPNAVESKLIPDASLGFYLYSSQFYVGIAAHQLLGNKYSFVEKDTADLTGISRLTQHIYLSGGYSFQLNREFAIRPTALLKYANPGQFQAELDAVVYYDRTVWGGLAYRFGTSGYFSSDAIAVMVGYNYENKMYIGLSYDITMSDLRRYSNGTIEVMIGYRFNSIK